MLSIKRVTLSVLATVAIISVLHVWLNVGFANVGFSLSDEGATTQSFRVGFLPVTCHLTCPVTDWINTNMSGESYFEPIRFSGWPELKEAFLARSLPATFMIVPMALVLREQDAPIKMVYLGHRDGTAMMVHKDSDIYSFKDLKGKRIAIPNRFSNQCLIIWKGLRDYGMSIDDVTLLEMPPPDMPAALYAKAVDAVISGEPFMAQTELDGYGRVLFQAREVWPDFISCVLVVHEDIIRDHRGWVQELVDGIAASGKWLDADQQNRLDISEAVSTKYYHQDPRLLRFVLSKPPDRVTYSNLALARHEFDDIVDLAQEAGLLEGSLAFEEYVDTTFVPTEPDLNAIDAGIPR